MARKRYKPEEIVSLLRQAEVLHGRGMSMAAVTPPLWLGTRARKRTESVRKCAYRGGRVPGGRGHARKYGINTDQCFT